VRRLREPLAAFAAVFATRDLRRLQLALIASVIADWAWSIAFSVYLYGRDGVAAVGIYQLARLVAAAVAAPLVATLADRYPRARVLAATDLARCALVGAVLASIAASAPLAVIAVLAGAIGVVATAFRPAQAALLPQLAQEPEQLAAANVASSTIEGAGSFIGPALAGILIATVGVRATLVAPVLAYLASAALCARIRAPAPPAADAAGEGEEHGGILAGFALVARSAPLRVLSGLLAAQTLLCGVLNVAVLVIAVRLVHVGEGGVGWLLAALGVGGLVGALPALLGSGSGRLATSAIAGLVLWSVPVVVLGAWPTALAAYVAFGLIGVGNTLFDVASTTLLQRVTPEHVMGRMFGVLEALVLAAVGVGSGLAPVLYAGIGIRATLIASGLSLALLTALCVPALRACERDGPREPDALAALRRVALLGMLPEAVLEGLAARASRVELAAGEVLFEAGAPADRYYVVERGTVAVLAEAGRRELTAGEGLGEIALLRDVPRTATVEATVPTTLLALERDVFVAAVTGHAPSAAAAEAVIAARLGGLRPVLGAV